MSTTEQAYQRTAVAGASGFGLLIALYDTLAGDLRRAADAERNNDIEKRCQKLNHAFLVIAYLEDWIEQGSGGELAQKLVRFYASLRRKIIEAQAKRSAEILEQQMALVLKIRGTWQEIELRRPTTQETPYWAQTPGYLGDSPAQDQQNASSWSA